MNKKCYIVGAGDNSGTNFIKRENEYVIAADGGLEILKKINIMPDIIVGDFDSLGYIPEGNNVIKHKIEKDDTDMMLSVKLAIDKGYDIIEIFGGTGGRIDHTIANLQTMLYASKKGVEITMTDKERRYHVLTANNITLDGKKAGDLSVFAIGGKAFNVSIKGAKYEADRIDLEPDNPTAVSNSYIGSDVKISVEQGSVLIISDR